MNVDVGRAGDFIAAAALSRMSVQSVISQQPGFDLVAFVPEPVRIEVKTASKRSASNDKIYAFMTSRGSKKKSPLTRETADIVCLVALPERLAIFRHIDEITGSLTRLHAYQFTYVNEEKSWLETVECLK